MSPREHYGIYRVYNDPNAKGLSINSMVKFDPQVPVSGTFVIKIRLKNIF
jgi:hypothetical protein